jgi:hypothetical protein
MFIFIINLNFDDEKMANHFLNKIIDHGYECAFCEKAKLLVDLDEVEWTDGE